MQIPTLPCVYIEDLKLAQSNNLYIVQISRSFNYISLSINLIEIYTIFSVEQLYSSGVFDEYYSSLPEEKVKAFICTIIRILYIFVDFGE